MSTKAAADIGTEYADRADFMIHQTFSLLERALDDARVLDDFPDKGALDFRELDHRGHVFQLTAVQEAGRCEWMARPTRYTLILGAPYLQRPLVDEPSGGADPVALTRLFSATAETADAAFDDLAAQLRVAVDAALLVDDGEPVGHRGSSSPAGPPSTGRGLLDG